MFNFSNNFLLFKPMFNLEQCTSIHYQSLSHNNSIKFSTETSQKYQFETPNICHSLVTENKSIWHHSTLLKLIFRKSPNLELFLISSNSSSIPFALAQSSIATKHLIEENTFKKLGAPFFTFPPPSVCGSSSAWCLAVGWCLLLLVGWWP